MISYKKASKEFKKNKGLFFMSLPGLVFIIIFAYIPMVGLIIAFKDYTYDKGIFGSKCIGFENFKFFFTSDAALRVTRNTILLNLLFIIAGTIISIICALMLYELNRRAVKLYQTILFFPFFISWVVASYAAYALMNYEFGGINLFLKNIGSQPIEWYLQYKYWIVILFIAYIWKNVGYFCLLYYTGLLDIDPVYFEAAKIDGASKWQQVWNVSLPLISPLVIMLVLLNIGKIFYADFGLFYFLPKNSGALFKVTDVIDTYVYRSLKTTGDIGMASAVGFYQSIMGFILVMISNFIVKRFDKDKSLF